MALSRALVKEVFEKVQQINTDTGVSLLIAEQKVRDLLPIFDRVYSVKLGRVAFEGKPDGLLADSEKLKALFL